MPDGIVTAFNRLRGLAMPFAGGFLGGLAAGGVAQTVDSLRHVATEIANIGNEARRAGLGTDAFQEWANVADQNRISIDALTDGFKELSCAPTSSSPPARARPPRPSPASGSAPKTCAVGSKIPRG